MPNRFTPVNSSSSTPALVNQINQNFAKLDAEAVVKQFKGGNGDALLIGKTGDTTLGMKITQGTNTTMQVGLYDGKHYGLLFYQDGVPVQLIGQAPDDGRMGNWTAKPGQNVLTLLGA
jgi:hypothetical protein